LSGRLFSRASLQGRLIVEILKDAKPDLPVYFTAVIK
jgi:hypothetical protein